VAREVLGTLKFACQGEEIDLTPPWRRLDLRESLTEIGGIPATVVRDRQALVALAREEGVTLRPGEGYGRALTKLFDLKVEARLQQPTFILGYPRETSPLSRGSDTDPEVVDRFELFINGREMANAFSELNDPLDQRQRDNTYARRRHERCPMPWTKTSSRPCPTACRPPRVKASVLTGW
jgi:lysyl-tRNA synthetase class 2